MTFPTASDALGSLREGITREPRYFTGARSRGRKFRVAGAGDSAAASGIDLLVYVAACPFILTFCALVLRGMWPIGALAFAQAFLALSWAEGRSPGMLATGTRLVDARTCGRPGFAAGLMRASLVLPAGIAAFLLADAAVSHHASFSSNAYVVWGSVGVIAATVVSHAWMAWDPAGRALHDRLSGVVFVHDEPIRRHLAHERQDVRG